MKRYMFSLVELLVVIGIIGLLVGLLVPAVINGKNKAMVTQAKSDMHAIRMALKGVESNYSAVVKPPTSGNDFSFNKKSLKPKSASIDGDTLEQLVLGLDAFAGSNSGSVNAYDQFIRELTVPQEIQVADRNINVRNLKLLDPRPDYDKDNTDTIWRDPWGSPYVIMINTNFKDKVFLPIDTNKVKNGATMPANVKSNHWLLSGNVFLYSLGPNGEDDTGLNANNIGKRNTDDICNWEK